jgi:hypothetical protein
MAAKVVFNVLFLLKYFAFRYMCTSGVVSYWLKGAFFSRVRVKRQRKIRNYAANQSIIFKERGGGLFCHSPKSGMCPVWSMPRYCQGYIQKFGPSPTHQAKSSDDPGGGGWFTPSERSRCESKPSVPPAKPLLEKLPKAMPP